MTSLFAVRPRPATRQPARGRLAIGVCAAAILAASGCRANPSAVKPGPTLPASNSSSTAAAIDAAGTAAGVAGSSAPSSAAPKGSAAGDSAPGYGGSTSASASRSSSAGTAPAEPVVTVTGATTFSCHAPQRKSAPGEPAPATIDFASRSTQRELIYWVDWNARPVAPGAPLDQKTPQGWNSYVGHVWELRSATNTCLIRIVITGPRARVTVNP